MPYFYALRNTRLCQNVTKIITESEPALGDSAGLSGQSLQTVLDIFEVGRRTSVCSGRHNMGAVNRNYALILVP